MYSGGDALNLFLYRFASGCVKDGLQLINRLCARRGVNASGMDGKLRGGFVTSQGNSVSINRIRAQANPVTGTVTPVPLWVPASPMFRRQRIRLCGNISHYKFIPESAEFPTSKATGVAGGWPQISNPYLVGIEAWRRLRRRDAEFEG